MAAALGQAPIVRAAPRVNFVLANKAYIAELEERSAAAAAAAAAAEATRAARVAAAAAAVPLAYRSVPSRLVTATSTASVAAAAANAAAAAGDALPEPDGWGLPPPETFAQPASGARTSLAARVEAPCRARARAAAALQPSLPHRHPSYGEVPPYLRRRAVASSEEAASATAAAAEAATTPPGMRRVPAAERAAMLESLGDALVTTRAELATYRLSPSAPSAMRRREELLARELALEEALSVFAKETVYVRR